MLSEINGDLLSCGCEMIVQQSNCITIGSAGLAWAISQRLDVDVYSYRTRQGKSNVCTISTQDTPGTVKVVKSPVNGVLVANMFAQYTPGKPQEYYKTRSKKCGYVDDATQRLNWFNECLNELADYIIVNNVKTIAFPKFIGCGLAEGDWAKYRATIKEWTEENDFDVKIVELK